MDSQTFNAVIDEQIHLCQAILKEKGIEYATDDRLHNFRRAAKMQGVPMRQALAGMMAKHTISLYDMCAAPRNLTISLWEEKITDHINYLLLLAAVIKEEENA